MRRLTGAILFAVVACGAQTPALQFDVSSQGDAPGAPSKSPLKSEIILPAGTTIILALTSPVLARTAKVGDSIYARTVFPVALTNQLSIPAGTFVQGQIGDLDRPGILSPRAHFLIRFSKIIFVDGYTVLLPGSQSETTASPPVQNASATSAMPAIRADDVAVAVANTYAEVSSANDVLLDNGTQIEMLLQLPLRLNATQVADALRKSTTAPLPQFKSATQCRPTLGSPGTSDTVIPGSPGSSGTPDVVIPGAPGMPDTVIPGIPATSGTPGTVISGTPGTPGTVCPGPAVIAPDPKARKYKESLQLSAAVQVSGQQLPAGSYQLTWEGLDQSVKVSFAQRDKVLASVPAKIVFLSAKSPAYAPGTRANPDGSVSLQSLRFAGQDFALYFSKAAP